MAIGSPSYICRASPLMISPLKRSAKETASYCIDQLGSQRQGGKNRLTSDLPVPVDPTMAIRGRFGAAGAIVSHRDALLNIGLVREVIASLRWSLASQT